MKSKLLVFAASLLAAAPVSAQVPALSQFQSRLLAAQNAARFQAGVPPLAWDSALAAGAAIIFAHDSASDRQRVRRRLPATHRGWRN